MVRIICYLLFVIFLGSRSSQAGGPLLVVYPEDVDDDVVEGEMQQDYIDNQSYLREEQLRERALRPPAQAPAVVIRKSERVRRFLPFQYPPYRNDQSDSFLGIEVNDGATSVLYYEKYQPNCCWPRYYYRPASPVADPYRASKDRKR